MVSQEAGGRQNRRHVTEKFPFFLFLSVPHRPPLGTGQVRVNESVQHLIGGEPDEASGPLTLAILINLGLSKSRVPAKPEQDESGPTPLNNRIEEGQNAIG